MLRSAVSGTAVGTASRRVLRRAGTTVVDRLSVRARAIGTRLPGRWLTPLIWAAWMPFALQPTLDLLQSRRGTLSVAICLAAVAVFFAIYLWAAWDNPLSRR